MDLQALHDRAMEALQAARAAQRKGSKDLYQVSLMEAFRAEAECAWSLIAERDLEPSRSLIFAGAADLAYELGFYDETLKLALAGLTGNPPKDVGIRLWRLAEDVKFNRYLRERDITLEEDQVEMSFSGQIVGHGAIPSAQFIRRLDYFRTMLIRTGERLQGRPFRERGEAPKRLSEGFDLFLFAPQAGSFKIKLQLGYGKQFELFDSGIVEDSIEETLACLDLINNEDTDTLYIKIKDVKYRKNFIGLARNIAPDGSAIERISLSSKTRGRQSDVLFSLPRNRIREIQAAVVKEGVDTSNEPIEFVEGILLVADSDRSRDGRLVVKDNNGKPHVIFAPLDQMTDIVKPLFEEKVRVRFKKVKEKRLLADIEALE